MPRQALRCPIIARAAYVPPATPPRGASCWVHCREWYRGPTASMKGPMDEARGASRETRDTHQARRHARPRSIARPLTRSAAETRSVSRRRPTPKDSRDHCRRTLQRVDRDIAGTKEQKRHAVTPARRRQESREIPASRSASVDHGAALQIPTARVSALTSGLVCDHRANLRYVSRWHGSRPESRRGRRERERR